MPGRLGGQQLRHVGVGAAFLAGVEQRRGAAADHVGRLQFGIGARQRELHPLVLADRPVEDDPLLGVFDALVAGASGRRRCIPAPPGCARRSCRRGCSGSPCPPRRSGFRPAPSRLSKNTSVVLWLIIASIGRISTPLPEALAQIDQEHRQPVGAPLDLLDRGGARQQQHQIGVPGARGPHLLAVDEIVVAVAGAHRAGLQLGRVGAGGRLGDAEGLQPQFARGDLRQIALLLLLAAVPQQGAHDVHLGVALAGGAARGVDLLEDHRGGAQRQARAAIFLRDQRGEKAGLRSIR